MNVTHQAKWLTLFALLINAAAMLSPVINGGDSITYAALSQYIALNNDWASLMLDGKDWLDKPHLPFWITALSFKIGGISAFTYILPGFLFHLVGGYYTYRIARLFYGRDTAWLSVLVYVSVYHLMDSSIEVKAETYLTAFIMGACYYWLRYDAQIKIKYLLLGAAFSAAAVMTKGVFTLITISSGLVCMWMVQQRWSKLWSGKWLLAFALSLLFTTPEVIALYLQFDAHPEKVVFGQTDVSGIKFFLWDSQFGRFFNTGPIKNQDGHVWYFVSVFLWAFLPWVAVFVAAMVSGVRKFLAGGTAERAHFIFLCGAFFITFLLFSATKFQLDHYTVILFPFAAILCGQFLTGHLVQSDGGKPLRIAQWVLTILLVGLSVGLSVQVGSPLVLMAELVLLAALLAYGYVARQQMRTSVVLVFPVFGIVMLYTFLVLTTAQAFTAYSVAYNANRQLAGRAAASIYVYQMDIVARELGLYQRAPCYAVDDAAQLPTTGRYILLLRAEQLEQLRDRLGDIAPLGQGRWVVHKTGTLPKLLRMAQGTEPLEDIRLIEVSGTR